MTATQAPKPGPLSASDVKLLVKGDLLRRTDGSIVAVHEHQRTEDTLVCAALGKIVIYGPPEDFAFIGRPDADGWMPWSGGENPVPGRMVEWSERDEGPSGIALSDVLRWDHSGDGCDIIAFRLAPTAPVEASGSEREQLIEIVLSFPETVDLPTQRAEDLANEILAALRPQPSGETREAVARLAEWRDRMKSDEGRAAHFGSPYADKPMANGRIYWNRDLAADLTTVLALLSGGQQGEEVRQTAMSILQSAVRTFDAEDRTNLDAVLDDLIDALSTTPARAEAQDEGAAGEPYGWIYERLDVGPGWCAPQEWWPAQFTKKAPTPGRSRNIITLYTRPSPTPAADADRVRAWDAFAARINWELSHGYPDGEEEDGCWLVHSVNGGRNDREWTLIGRGETPLDAALDALKSTAAKEGGEG